MTNWTHNRNFYTPFNKHVFSTHGEHILQTMMSNRCFKKTCPHLKVGDPILLRADTSGISIYSMPQWAKEGEQALAAKMAIV